MVDKLTRGHIIQLFSVTQNNPDKLSRNEDTSLEYKLSFQWDEKIAKTCAAMANAHGGYIVFGINDKTRIIEGLSNENYKKFEDFDIERATNALNEIFTPNVQINKKSHMWREKNIGILYIHESYDKPIIATKNSGRNQEIKEGDIYYSYDGRRERIKYGEFRKILEDREQSRLHTFFKHLDLIAKIGINNAAIMDTENGTVIGPGIKSFIIDDELVDQLKFIKEGEFNEVKGKPTLKLIGQLHERDSSGEFYNYQMIHKDDIFKAFIEQNSVNNPEEFIKFMYTGSTKYVPIYYYADLANMVTIDDMLIFAKDLDKFRPDIYSSINNRLATSDNLCQPIKESNTLAFERKMYYNTFAKIVAN
jgi:hypothetical protein